MESDMEIFWREVRRGQRLVLSSGEGMGEEEIGGVRETKRGFDAFAKTFGYEPGRAMKGMETLDEGQKIQYDLVEGANGKSSAENIVDQGSSGDAPAAAPAEAPADDAGDGDEAGDDAGDAEEE